MSKPQKKHEKNTTENTNKPQKNTSLEHENIRKNKNIDFLVFHGVFVWCIFLCFYIFEIRVLIFNRVGKTHEKTRGKEALKIYFAHQQKNKPRNLDLRV